MKSLTQSLSLVIVLFIPFFAFTQAKGGLSADVYYEKGKALHIEGDIQIAIEFYDIALVSDSYHADALFNRAIANAELALPKYKKAWDDINTLLNINPLDKEALLWRAKLSYKLKNYGQSIQDYSSLLLSETSDYRLFINRGIAYAELSQYEYALSDFDAALNINNTLELAWAGKGQCAFELQQYEEATNCYLQAINLVPENLHYKYGLSEALIKNNQFEDAKSILEKLIIGNADASTKSMTSLALCYLNLGELENAKILAEAAVVKDIRDSEVYRVLGMVSFFEKKYSQAKAYFLEAVAWADGYTEAYKNVAQIYLINGEYGPAKSYADEAIRWDARSGGAFYIRALAYKGLSLSENACDDFFKAASLGFDVDTNEFYFCK